MAAFTRTYAGAKLDRIITDEGRAHVYVFKRGDHHIVAVFAPSEPVMITLRSEAREGHIMDAMGNLTKLDDSTQIQIEATPYPKTVILQGARDVR